MGKNQHVVPNSKGGWGVKGENNERLTVTTKTQKEAIEKAKVIAKNKKSEVIIRRPNGQIRDKDSYGNDPTNIKDKKH